MLGAILGDIIGSPYEFTRNNIKTTDFPLFSEESQFTDDTVMTVAVAEGMLDSSGDADAARVKVVTSMRKYGRMYPFGWLWAKVHSVAGIANSNTVWQLRQWFGNAGIIRRMVA